MPSAMSQASSLPLTIQSTLQPVWTGLDSITIIPSSTNNDTLIPQFQLRLALARLRLSRWAVCLASSTAAESDPACQASAELLTDLGAELERVGYGAQMSQSHHHKLSRPSGKFHEKVDKVVSSRAAQISLPTASKAGSSQIALYSSESHDIDFLLGWASSTLTSLEGLLTTSSRKMGRDLCAKEASIVAASGDETARQNAIDALAFEVREHRDVFLGSAVGGGM